MTTALETPFAFPVPERRTRVVSPVRSLAVAAVASLSAGAIHAAAIGAHAEHPRAAEAFVAVALFQLGWGAWALARRSRAIAAVGALGNLALVVAWAVAKTNGLSFIDGLNEVEPVQLADGLAAALAAISALTAVAVLRDIHLPKPRPVLAGVTIGVLGLSSLPGMVEAGKHVHSHATGTAFVVDSTGRRAVAASAVVPPKPYDPTKPIDLSGVAGVTPEEQARAENLIAVTLATLPKWKDPAAAEADNFHSIGDGVTGFEHYVNYDYATDKTILDPAHPESLVYRVKGGTKTLAAAMFMLPPGSTLDSVPDLGGKLTQWHVHDNLCFTPVDPPRVAGLTNADGTCNAPLVKFAPVPMIHVWIVPHPCGPFAALEGIGAGQIKPGEQRLCDHVHGSAGGGL